MKKLTVKGLVVATLAIIVNVCAFPVAAFSLFSTQEGTSIFSIDYLLAAGIQLAPNIIIIQLMMALRKNKQSFIIAGWIVLMVEILLFFLIYQGDIDLEWLMYSGFVIVAIAIALLIKTIRLKS